jgi:hypothetical protein
MFEGLTAGEKRYLDAILAKDAALRALLSSGVPNNDPLKLLAYLIAVKSTLGNLNNDVSFVASLLVKPLLRERFGIEFDAAFKAQGASGSDVECLLPDGNRVVGEIKTTKPYQPGFGAAQKKEITKDLLRLANSDAEHRFMFVTDAESYRTICSSFLQHVSSPWFDVENVERLYGLEVLLDVDLEEVVRSDYAPKALRAIANACRTFEGAQTLRAIPHLAQHTKF